MHETILYEFLPILINLCNFQISCFFILLRTCKVGERSWTIKLRFTARYLVDIFYVSLDKLLYPISTVVLMLFCSYTMLSVFMFYTALVSFLSLNS